MGGEHEHGMMGSVIWAEVSRDAIIERVRDVVLGIGPSFWVRSSFFEPFLKDGPNPVLLLPQAKSCWMRHPARENEVEHAANVGFHAMKQTVQFFAVFGVEVWTHETFHDDSVDELGNMLEEIDLLFSRPIGQESPRGFSGKIRVMVQRCCAVDTPTQRPNERLKIVKIPRFDNFIQEKSLQNDQFTPYWLQELECSTMPSPNDQVCYICEISASSIAGHVKSSPPWFPGRSY